MSVKYTCHLKVESAFNIALNNIGWIAADHPDDFKNGFWLSKDYKLTNPVDGKYWIPPSAIIYVEKENE